MRINRERERERGTERQREKGGQAICNTEKKESCVNHTNNNMYKVNCQLPQVLSEWITLTETNQMQELS